MKKWLFLYCTFLSIGLSAQIGTDQYLNCSTPHDLMPEADHKAYVEAMTKKVEQYRIDVDSVIIPIVVHNPHWYHVGYVDDRAIVETIQQMNDALANRRSEYDSLGFDTKIRLCLAGTDPYGNSTTGILHPHHEMAWNTNFFYIPDFFTPEIQWDTAQYLNIYIADSYNGVSSFPWSTNVNELDGFVVHTNNMTIRGGLGVFIHEIGHYLGLYHTFGQTNNSGSCRNDNCLDFNDEVCDTPPQIFKYTPNFPVNSCNTDVNFSDPNNPFFSDQLDMINNFMSGGRWQSRFTQGQIDRMHWVLQTYRPNLVVTDSDNRCSTCKPLEVGGMIPIQSQLVGEEFTVKNNSQGDLSFIWYVDETVVSTEQNLSYTLTSGGFKIIRLEGYDSNNIECSQVWTWEQAVYFKCQENIEIREPEYYFLDSCYTIQTKGLNELTWSHPFGIGSSDTITFCPTESGIQAITFEYGEGACLKKDTLWVNVEDITSLDNRYWREQFLFEDNSYAPSIVRSRKLNGNRLVLLGRENKPNNKIIQKTFFRFGDNDGVLKEEWQIYHPDSSVFYIPSDFIVDSLGNTYMISLLKHISTTSGKFLVTRINRLGDVDWCKQINMPKHLYHRLVATYRRNHLTFEGDDIVLEIQKYFIRINKDGELIDAYNLQRLPYDKYEEYYQDRCVLNFEDEEFITFMSSTGLIDFDLYSDYDESLSEVSFETILIGKINKANKSIQYKYFTGLPFSIKAALASIGMKNHPNGMVAYWTNRITNLHVITMFNHNLEIEWQKVYEDDQFKNTNFNDDADIFVSKNGDIHIYSTTNYGAYLVYFRFNKDGDLLENYVIENEQQEIIVPSVLFLDTHESGLITDGGFLVISSMLTDSTAKLIIQHQPLDTSLFNCDIINYNTLKELPDTILISESYLTDSLKIIPAEVSLQDAEIYIRKSTYETEVWCETSYPVEDYSIQIRDTSYQCPDSMIISLTICRKKSTLLDTISLIQYPLSPLDTITTPDEIREVYFETGENCTREDWVTNVTDHHFIINTNLNKLTPYTLEATFFDAHDKMEFEYRNNYVLVEGNCQMVTTEEITQSRAIKIFPNPTSGELYVTLNQGSIQQLGIYTTLGKQVQQYSANGKEATIAVGQFPKGIYLLEIQTASGQTYWRKVMVQ